MNICGGVLRLWAVFWMDRYSVMAGRRLVHWPRWWKQHNPYGRLDKLLNHKLPRGKLWQTITRKISLA